jgi:hypothetical protein
MAEFKTDYNNNTNDVSADGRRSVSEIRLSALLEKTTVTQEPRPKATTEQEAQQK